MYKKRQKIYKDLQLQSNNENDFSSEEEGGRGEGGGDSGGANGSVNESIANDGNIANGYSITNDGSIAKGSDIANNGPDTNDRSISNNASVIVEPNTSSSKEKDAGYKPLSLQSRMKDNRPIEIGYRSTIISSHKQDDHTQKLIPKKAEWQLMLNPVRMQVRQILSDNYRKTLSNIAGSAANGELSKATQKKGESLLVPVAASIDRDLRLTLIPGKVETRLLDPKLPQAYTKIHKQLEENYRKIADFSILVNQREAGLTQLKDELAELEERYRIAKERSESGITTKENPNDYVQMLMLHPSSEQY
ncbi:hypothetical protein INT46_009672 [Mucor plumbeus]|uniref:Uncharacterized protein n=1 Tax=Mucor plumbeus TaxID=97098 RepID=A0A8H7QLI9_9FUNG|nr:hypothetical protein INT46_009672 [Mucor plumbeus]